MKTIVVRRAAKDRVAWTKSVCSESFVSFSAPSGAASPRSNAANAGTSSGVCGNAARADAERGAKHLDYLAGRLATLIGEVGATRLTILK